ncbi:nucleoside hydrolase [Humibacter sp. RRB41]|uniref:nucleoside hydrolase n=1 Tax=Humibacter sp. RRB41 TaxID=2919946 RepID=UPI001FAAB742|nr:nucleoside hydrolase [Humibacter sp. RRB41]
MTRLILDCDTGTDDAIAMIAAVGHPQLELVAVTTVNGNVSLEHTTDNSLRVLDLLGASVPVYPGADRPFVRDDMPIPRDVLNADNPEFQVASLPFPEPVSVPAIGSAIEFLIETYLAADADDIVLVATGPLTNIAAALAVEPRLASRIPRLVVMGGSVIGGNVTASAEFNFWVDADAAQAVLAAGIRDVMIVPLDATHSVPLTRADCAALAALGTTAGRAISDLVLHRIETDGEAADDGAPVHDPLCVAALVDPGVLTRVVNRPATVEAAGELTVGELVVDMRPWTAESPTTHIALAADHDRFVTFLLDAVRS